MLGSLFQVTVNTANRELQHLQQSCHCDSYGIHEPADQPSDSWFGSFGPGQVGKTQGPSRQASIFLHHQTLLRVPFQILFGEEVVAKKVFKL